MKKIKFKPFDKVLVRDNNSNQWKCDLFSHAVDTALAKYVCVGSWYKYCIPYEGNEALLGTTDDYVEPWQPKDGDFVFLMTEGNTRYITIHHYTDKNGRVYNHAEINPDVKCINILPVNDSFLIWKNDCKEYRLATVEEKQLLLSKLHEIGKKWNVDKKCIEDAWTPKDGDFVYAEPQSNFDRPVIFIFQNHDEKNWIRTYAHCYDDGTNFSFMSNYPSYCKPYSPEYLCYWDEIEMMRIATEEEKQQLLDALHKEGKDWDESKKEIVEYRWKPNKGDEYFFVTSVCGVYSYDWIDDSSDKDFYNTGNCFRTREEAQAMADKLKELLKGGKHNG